jgi:ceramide glucosyltransferase
VFALAIAAACLLAGSAVYCALVVVAARNYLAQKMAPAAHLPPISVLKPLAGVDEGLEANLRSFFTQQHPEFELLFAVREAGDPAVPVVEALEREFPARASRLIVTGEPPYPNAKVFSLDQMLASARYDLLVMSDSDIRVAPGFLESIAAEFADPRIALATCPYRALAGRSLWSRLEAEGMNTEFLAGMLVARLVEGVKFAVGPTVAARRAALQAIGGFPVLKDYLAEDFVMGKFAAEAGFGVILSRNIVEHRIGSQGFSANASHRIRWARSTRRSRPLGYVGQIFTHSVPIALLAATLGPVWWPGALLLLGARAVAAWATCRWVLNAEVRWGLLILQDLLSLFFWLAGFVGNTIVWRGRRYYLYSDGRFELRS